MYVYHIQGATWKRSDLPMMYFPIATDIVPCSACSTQLDAVPALFSREALTIGIVQASSGNLCAVPVPQLACQPTGNGSGETCTLGVFWFRCIFWIHRGETVEMTPNGNSGMRAGSSCPRRDCGQFRAYCRILAQQFCVQNISCG